MVLVRSFLLLFFTLLTWSTADPKIRLDELGRSLGGWTDKSGKAAKFEVSGSTYRSWKPEVSPTPTGGIFDPEKEDEHGEKEEVERKAVPLEIETPQK